MIILNPNHAWFILFLMFFLHIVEDFNLQGILTKMKQKDWWLNQEGYNGHYKFDYIFCLIAHGFSWCFFIMLPVFWLHNFELKPFLVAQLVFHSLFHAWVDNDKANDKGLNLVQDQICHILQIFIIWASTTCTVIPVFT